MTRARALKQVIRARAEKTGERYTTARRHVLRELNADTQIDKPKGLSPRRGSSPAPPSPAPPAPPALPALPALPAPRGGLSDAKSIEKTGHDLAHWFAILDAFGGIAKGHTASTALLHDNYKVPGWYCQGIVVAYERARGKRVMNQRGDGAFEVSVSKVIAANTPSLVKAFTGAMKRTSAKPSAGKRWIDNIDPDLARALVTAFKDPKSKGFITRPDGQARFRFKWADTTVQLNLYPKGEGKTSIVAQQMKLRDAGDVERYRKLWKTAFTALASAVSTTS